MKIRRLNESDLPLRVQWVNDVRVNNTMHFEVPITIEGTMRWFSRVADSVTRIDFAFEEDGQVCAMGGLTSIDQDAELYIFVNPNLHGKKIGSQATSLLCEYGFLQLHLGEIYLFTNGDNMPAQRVYERIGFQLVHRDINSIHNGSGELVDRLKYTLIPKDFKPFEQ